MAPGEFDALLEKLVIAVGDPVELVYDELFQAVPDLQHLFVLDTNGSVRGSMLTETLNLLSDLADNDTYATNFLRAEQSTHEGYGVPKEAFPAFLDAIERVMADALEGQWTPEERRGFLSLIDRARIIAAKARVAG